nr:hypothetical protein CFP56_11439 [Quercus suber]
MEAPWKQKGSGGLKSLTQDVALHGDHSVRSFGLCMAWSRRADKRMAMSKRAEHKARHRANDTHAHMMKR